MHYKTNITKYFFLVKYNINLRNNLFLFKQSIDCDPDCNYRFLN